MTGNLVDVVVPALVCTLYTYTQPPHSALHTYTYICLYWEFSAAEYLRTGMPPWAGVLPPACLGQPFFVFVWFWRASAARVLFSSVDPWLVLPMCLQCRRLCWGDNLFLWISEVPFNLFSAPSLASNPHQLELGAWGPEQCRCQKLCRKDIWCKSRSVSALK